MEMTNEAYDEVIAVLEGATLDELNIINIKDLLQPIFNKHNLDINQYAIKADLNGTWIVNRISFDPDEE